MNLKKIITPTFTILIIALFFYVIHINKKPGLLEFNFSEEGIILDETTAIEIAEIIGFKVFGQNLKDYMPLHAYLKDDTIWHVYGLPKKSQFFVQMGGGPVIEIQKKDTKLINIYISN